MQLGGLRSREILEQTRRYITHPALCLERLSLHTDGRVRLGLKRQRLWRRAGKLKA